MIRIICNNWTLLLLTLLCQIPKIVTGKNIVMILVDDLDLTLDGMVIKEN